MFRAGQKLALKRQTASFMDKLQIKAGQWALHSVLCARHPFSEFQLLI
jgi:hypothetical protein